jgi:hypothetical protein
MSTSNHDAVAQPLPEYVAWLAATFVALTGLAFATAGGVVLAAAERDLLATGVEPGRITVGLQERTLTEPEALAFTTTVMDWTALGLLATGAGLVVFAVGFAVSRHRSHRRGRDAAGDSRRTSAVFGAIATTLLSFLPLSPVFGGGIAAYLGRDGTGRSSTVGALSGLLAMAPMFSLLLFVTVGVAAGLSNLGESGLTVLSVAAMGVVALFVALYGAGCGALGGLLGERLADRD